MTIADIIEYMRTDHLWLYELIANKRMRVQRSPHWKQPPKSIPCGTEDVAVFVTHDEDGTSNVKTRLGVEFKTATWTVMGDKITWRCEHA